MGDDARIRASLVAVQALLERAEVGVWARGGPAEAAARRWEDDAEVVVEAIATALALVPVALPCAGKVRHPNRRLAHDQLRRHRARGRDALEVYECSHCQGFHLGRPALRR